MASNNPEGVVLSIKYIRTQQLVVEGHVNKQRLPILIDTGASQTVFHTETARELGLVFEKTELTGGGVGGVDFALFKLQPLLIKLGGAEWLCPKPVAMDLSHVVIGLKRARARKVTTILGADFLRKYEARIDYRNMEMTLFPNSPA